MAGPLELLGNALYGENWKKPLAFDFRVGSLTLTNWLRLPPDQQKAKISEKGVKLLDDRFQLMRQIRRELNGRETGP